LNKELGIHTNGWKWVFMEVGHEWRREGGDVWLEEEEYIEE
jgi:hypothetical protein